MKYILVVLAVLFSVQLEARPAQIFIIRHAEKVEDGEILSLKGFERAAALAPFFMGTPEFTKHGPPVAIYAMKPTDHDFSVRPVQTVSVLSSALKLGINDSYSRNKFPDMATQILSDPKYDGKTVLISWEHKNIPGIATALGAKDVPPKWNGEEFDRVWVLTYQDDGSVKFENVPQRLMFGDSEN
jgi:hypothetical protein